jgi:hypothetical protein
MTSVAEQHRRVLLDGVMQHKVLGALLLLEAARDDGGR